MSEWLRVFFLVLTRPKEETFKELAKSAKDKTSESLAWLAAISIYTSILTFVRYGADALTLGGAFVSIVILPIAFLIYSFFINLAYRRIFHRRRYVHEQILYITTAIFVPIQFAFVPLSIFPKSGSYIGWAGVGYLLLLMIVSLRSVLHIKLHQSIILVLLGGFLILASAFCASYFILSMVMLVPETIQ